MVILDGGVERRLNGFDRLRSGVIKLYRLAFLFAKLLLCTRTLGNVIYLSF